MEAQSYHIGIYLGVGTATVVQLGREGVGYKVLDCFSVVDDDRQHHDSELINLVSQRCSERIADFRDAEFVVALDCSMFLKQAVHSEFADRKQISTTVAFDAEDAFAIDITDRALAFRVNSSGSDGSELEVFAVDRKRLSGIIGTFKAGGIDPVSIEPDIVCLSRFIQGKDFLPAESGSIFAMLSQRRGYLTAFSSDGQPCVMRPFSLNNVRCRDEMLHRELLLTAALVEVSGSVDTVMVFDSAGSLDCSQLSKKIGTEVSCLEPADMVSGDSEILADCSEPLDFAVAFGAALAVEQKRDSTNFRMSFMPYQGRKLRMQKTVRVLSIAAVVVILAIGFYFQIMLFQKNSRVKQLRAKFSNDYLAVMLSDSRLPESTSEAVRKLSSEYRRIRSVQSGQLSVTGQKSVSAKLAVVLMAFNKCAKQTGLKIDSIAVTARNIIVTGDTSSRRNTLKLFDSIRQNGLDIMQQRLDVEAGRDNFHITLNLAEQAG